MHRARIHFALLALLLLSSCLPAASGPDFLPTPIPVSPATVTFTATSASVPALPPTPSVTSEPRPARVLILSIDGLRPELLELAPMPNLLGLLADSAYTLNAQTIYPSSTLPAHASMLTGQCRDKHGILWDGVYPPAGIAEGTDIFDLVHAKGGRTVMVAGKEKMRRLTQPASLDVYEFINDRDTVIAARVVALIPAGFDLMFVHFALVDGMGHVHGWLSPEQMSVAFRADEALGSILAALDESGLREDTLLIVTSDHGGHHLEHGSKLAEDMTIPWIAFGKGIHPRRLHTAVSTTDTAATAAWALGFPIPPEWDGLPVLEAFGLSDQPHLQPRCR
ncbi:MAG: alkaline phosphatase [Anaerolineales bacterium]